MKPKPKTKHAPSARFIRYRQYVLPPRLALLRVAYHKAPLLAGLSGHVPDECRYGHAWQRLKWDHFWCRKCGATTTVQS